MGGRGFEDERIVLRALEPDDAVSLQSYLNDNTLFGRRYVPWSVRDAEPLSHSHVAEILEEWGKEKSGFALGVLAKASGRLIGHATCEWRWDPHCPSISLVIAPSEQRVGYGSDVLRLLIAHLFLDTPAHTITGWIASWNEPALEFVAAHGFSECGRIPRAGVRDGNYYEQVVVDLLRREWLGRQGGPHAA
ncbi:MAG: GNAT family protein [Candidatus Bipolaricaulis sp.]|nr:GNAT family protein [Candidatus Bipolaricaulis sp.]